MKRTLLISTAVALVLGAGFAAAQDKKEGAAPAPAAQQKAPAEKIAPAQPMSKPAPMAQEHKAPETTGQAPKESAPKEPSGAMSPSPGPSKAESGKAGADTGGKAEVEKTSPTAPSSAQSKPDSKSTTTTGQTDTKSSTTTGQGAAGARGAVNLSTEQRTKIKTVIKEKAKAQPVTNVNFSISVGTKVPRTVHYYPLPAEVVTIYPAWRGYDFILVGDQIVVIDPATFEIVAVIEA